MKMKLLTLIVIGVFILFILVVITSFIIPNLSIITVNPTNGKNITTIYPVINVVFSRAVSDEEEKTISFVFSPQIEGSSSWSTNKNTFTFSPSQHLEVSTGYIATINYGKKNYSWTFNTPAGPALNDSDTLNLTAEGDEIFNNGIKILHETYPWYDNLPIITPDYFIGFAPGQSMFYIDVYPDSHSTVSINDQVVLLKKQASESLIKIGVDMSKYTITWGVLPK